MGGKTMLANLRRIHKPQSLDEAAALLKQPGVYPLYGPGASLIRSNNQEIEEAVDLTGLIGAGVHVGATSSMIEGCATLETLAGSDPKISSIVSQEAPETQRNAITVADLLMERPITSLTL